MKIIADDLRRIIDHALPQLENIGNEATSVPSGPDKWTIKEILGHLIDSACNNQQKFVRAMAQTGVEFPKYEQEHWVESQKYNQIRWDELIRFWESFNLHIAHIIENVDPNLLSNTITIDGAGPFTLEFIMSDYNQHLKHHLKQIVPDTEFDSSF